MTPRPPGVWSRSRMRSWVSPLLRWWTTRWPAKASTSSSRTAGSWGRSGCQLLRRRRVERRDAELEVGAGARCAAPGTGPRRRSERARASTPGPPGAARSSASRARGARRRARGTRWWSWSPPPPRRTGRCGCGRRRPRTAGRARGRPARRRPACLPRRVAPDLVGAPGVVDGRVVERLAGGVPGGAAEDAVDLVVEQLAGAEVLDPDRVALVADDVDGVGEQRAVGADARAAEGEEVVAVGQDVEVEQHLLAGQRRAVGAGVLGVGPRRRPVVGAGDGHPAGGAVLAALEGAAVVPVVAHAGSAPRGRSRGCGP